jgi:hypothetical protein
MTPSSSACTGAMNSKVTACCPRRRSSPRIASPRLTQRTVTRGWLALKRSHNPASDLLPAHAETSLACCSSENAFSSRSRAAARIRPRPAVRAMATIGSDSRCVASRISLARALSSGRQISSIGRPSPFGRRNRPTSQWSKRMARRRSGRPDP